MNSIKKIRLDDLVVKNGLAESKTKAQAYIMSGYIYLKKQESGVWERIEKAGHRINENSEIKIEGLSNQDVGRGAQKLRAAFQTWKLNIENKICLDIGSSTGGFTQVLLENKAAKVLALDVGTNQLHEKLKNDSRVISLEKQHVLKMDEKIWEKIQLKPSFDFICTDLSFISLTKVIPTAVQWLNDQGDWVVLVKPQFELEPKKTPKGIVKDPVHRLEALQRVKNCVESIGHLNWKSEIESPILGGDGNMEYLVWLKKIS